MLHRSICMIGERACKRPALYVPHLPRIHSSPRLMRFDTSCGHVQCHSCVRRCLVPCRPIEDLYESRAKRVVLVSGRHCRHLHRCCRRRPGVWPPLRSVRSVIACSTESKRQDGWRGRLLRIGSAVSAYLRGHRDMSCSSLSSISTRASGMSCSSLQNSHVSYHSLNLSVFL